MPKLFNSDQDLEVAGRLRICERTTERLRGLLGTRRLAEDQAVWIRPCNSIHTFFMLMTIDVAFVDEDLRVVKLIPAMTPWRVCLPVRRAASVIEGPVGMIRRGRLRQGAQLRVTEY
jgi:uncharacterized membrane protein (UPF0127 family)